MAALLGQVGGRQIGDDLLGGQSQADAGEGAAHALAALSHGLVREADDGEGALRTAQELDLHIHAPRVHAVEGNRDNPSDHGAPPSTQGERTMNRMDWQARVTRLVWPRSRPTAERRRRRR